MWFLETPFILAVILIIGILLYLLRTPLVAGIQLTQHLIRSSWYWTPLTWLYFALLLTYACRFPLSYDEAYTFKNFTSKSLFSVLCTYPQPNNHVFHSLLTWVSWKLFHWFPGPLAVRLPAIMASVLSFQLVQHFFLKRSAQYGQILLALMVITTNYFQFSFQARGYALHAFFALISYCLIQSKQANFNARYIGFMFFSFLALYTNPAYLFTAVTLGVYWLLTEIKTFQLEFRNVVLITITFALLTLLAYFPIMRHEGIDALIGNDFVQPLEHLTMRDLIRFTNKLGLFGFLPYPFAFITPLLFILFSLKQKHYARFSFVVVPFIMMYLMNQLPEFKRIFLPLTALMTFMTLEAITQWDALPQIKNRLISIIQPAILLIIIGLGLYYFEHDHKKYDFNTAFRLKRINQHVEHANKVYFSNLYWHLKIPVEAQRKYNRNEWIFKREIPNQLNEKEFLLSSLSLPQFHCIDTFPLHKGMAYLYIGK
ncbi:MAG: hypothetical protein ACR2IL_10625 [Chitinophagaceae bacterium]